MYTLVDKLLGYRITQILDRNKLILEIRSKTMHNLTQAKELVDRIQSAINHKGNFFFLDDDDVDHDAFSETDETRVDRIALSRLLESPNLKMEIVSKQVYQSHGGYYYELNDPDVLKYFEAEKWLESLTDKEKEYFEILSHCVPTA